MVMVQKRATAVLCLVFFMLTSVQAFAATQADTFFAGKTISIVVGFGPGGANDLWARTIAQHLARIMQRQVAEAA